MITEREHRRLSVVAVEFVDPPWLERESYVTEDGGPF